MKRHIITAVILSLVLTASCFIAVSAVSNSPYNATSITYGKAVTDSLPGGQTGYYKFRTSNAAGVTYYIRAGLVDTTYPESSYLSIGVMDKNGNYMKEDTADYSFDLEIINGGIGSYGNRKYILAPNTEYCFVIKASGFSDETLKYQASVEKSVNSPGKPKIKSLKAGKKKLTVRYSKAKYASKYQIQIKKKGGKWKTYDNGTKLKKTIKKLKKGAKYSVRIRAKRKVDGVWYKGKWSKVKTIRVK